MALRWKLEPKKTGLMAVGAPPRGSRLSDGQTEYAAVRPVMNGFRVTGWFWVTNVDAGIPRENTCNEPVPSVDDAKRDAMAFVKKHLAEAESKKAGGAAASEDSRA